MTKSQKPSESHSMNRSLFQCTLELDRLPLTINLRRAYPYDMDMSQCTTHPTVTLDPRLKEQRAITLHFAQPAFGVQGNVINVHEIAQS